jgi:hypothetical protein
MTWHFRQEKLGPGHYRITHYRVAPPKPAPRCECGSVIRRDNKSGACGACRAISNAELRREELYEKKRRGKNLTSETT